jgi:hypothetical protein
MDTSPIHTDQNHNLVTLIAGSFLAILFAALCVAVLVVGRSQVANFNAPTPTPANTPVPQVLIPPLSNETQVIHEDFSSDENLWGLYYDIGKLEIIDGKMILQSNVPKVNVIGTSRKLVPDADKYYIQADLSTDIEASSPYGLIFGSNHSLGTYYVFELWPQNRIHRLLKFNSGKWTELVPATRIDLNAYPFSNTLSIDFDHGNISLYINGKLASTFVDRDFFQSRDLGMFVSDTGYRLLVDDLFLYSEK